MADLIPVFVHTLRYEAAEIMSVELRPLDPLRALPAFEPGAHIDVHLPNGLVRNYSLMSVDVTENLYVFAVLHEKNSRGGSRFIFEKLRVGMALQISSPRNHFKLEESEATTVLIAGGIGITPLLAMARRLRSRGRPFEIIYCARTRKHAAFLPEIETFGVPLHLHFDDEQGSAPDLKPLLAARFASSPKSHFYACGPAPMLDAFERHCNALGIANAHVERFTAPEKAAAADAQKSYVVILAKSKREITVAGNPSLLQTLRAAGIAIATSCEEGICGTCETKVLAGVPDHRDHVLSAAEQAANRSMMVCVSICKSETLTLDL